MVKTRRVKRSRRVSRKKLNPKRRGRGKVHELPFLVKTMLNNVNVKANNAEFYEKGIVEKIMTMVPKRDVVKAMATKALADKAKADKALADKVNADKAEYERRILAAIPLNEKILKTQEAEIKRLEMSGINGPSRRTRSGARPTIDPTLLALYLERDYTERAIMANQYALQQLQNESPRPRFIPRPRVNYAELLRPKPGWDDERMAYIARERGREAYYV